MKRSGLLFLFVLFILLISQGVSGAEGISDAGIKEIFPAGSKVDENKTITVPGQGYFGAEIIMTIPYKEKISGADADYKVYFYFRKQILDFSREQSESIVEQNLAQFANGSYVYWGTPLEFAETGTTSGINPCSGEVGTTTINPPQKVAVAGGIVWFQRTDQVVGGRQQVYYDCHYAARVGDFVATLDANVPDSREKADEWFKSLIVACK